MTKESNDFLCICCINVRHANSKCEYFTLRASLSFFLSPIAHDSESSPPAEKEKAQQYYIRIKNRFGFDDTFSITKKWKHLPASERAAAVLFSSFSSSCEKSTNMIKLRLNATPHWFYLLFPSIQTCVLYMHTPKHIHAQAYGKIFPFSYRSWQAQELLIFLADHYS